MRKSLFSAVFPLAAALLAPACSPHAAQPVAPAAGQENAHHPVSGLEVVPLIVAIDGREHHFRVEVARTDAQQAQGLMFRREMGADEGMIFPRDPPRIASFWMKNTVMPLDIIFIGPDRRVINVAADTVPYSTDAVVSEGPAAAVLELNAGRAAELGIGPGALVEW